MYWKVRGGYYNDFLTIRFRWIVWSVGIEVSPERQGNWMDEGDIEGLCKIWRATIFGFIHSG